MIRRRDVERYAAAWETFCNALPCVSVACIAGTLTRHRRVNHPPTLHQR